MSHTKSLLLSLENIYETLAICWPTVVDAALGRVTKEVCDQRLGRFSRNIVENAAIELTVRGKEHLAPGQAYLVMSNHQSLYDVPVLFCTLGQNVRMIAKQELFNVPVFGGALKHSGFVSIDRRNRTKAVASLAQAKEILAAGTHVWIAPEGTRSPDGRLLPFKKGGFTLALETGWPILPITLKGTRDVLRARGVRSTPGKEVTVIVHKPVDTTRYLPDGRATGGERGVDKQARERLLTDVKAIIESAL